MSKASRNSIDNLTSLIGYPSVSSTSNEEISSAVSERLEQLGFRVERSTYLDPRGTTKVNLVACRAPRKKTGATSGLAGGLAYFCHTDVVPANEWTGPGGDPFDAVTVDERLYGRGSCDMKGSLVAMMSAADSISAADQTDPLWIVCTADEEVGFDGAKHLVKQSDEYQAIVAAQPLAIIGEPTRLTVVHAHKGIVGFEITSHGRAAHSSTTDGINANKAIVPMLQTLLEINEQTLTQDKFLDNRFDPPTLSWNFGVSDGGTAVNVTAEKSVARVSLRPMPNIDGEELIELARQRAEALGLTFQRFDGGGPLWIESDAEHIQQLCELAGGEARTVCYGTDGGEFTQLDRRVVFGPGDISQAHTTDEWIDLDQLARGTDLYAQAIRRYCCR